MESADKFYPDYLNPFGSDEEGDGDDEQGNRCTTTGPVDEYPDYLSPFDDNDEQEAGHKNTAKRITSVEDYDDSLNPFGDDDDRPDKQLSTGEQQSNKTAQQQQEPCDDEDLGEGNPFAEELEADQEDIKQTPVAVAIINQPLPSTGTETFNGETAAKAIGTMATATATPSQETLDKPPVPLPRTKSLLKKELAAQKRLKQQLQQQQLNIVETPNHAITSPQVAEKKNDSVLEGES